MAYQLESSQNLTTWTNLGPVIIGTGNLINFPLSIAGQSQGFFRLRFPGVASAVFDPGTGVLTIIGDPLNNTIVVSRDAAGNLRVNNGAVTISGGVPTVVNTTLIRDLWAGRDAISFPSTKPMAHCRGRNYPAKPTTTR